MRRMKKWGKTLLILGCVVVGGFVLYNNVPKVKEFIDKTGIPDIFKKKKK